MGGFDEAFPPRDLSFSARIGGEAADAGGKESSWRDCVPPNLPTVKAERESSWRDCVPPNLPTVKYEKINAHPARSARPPAAPCQAVPRTRRARLARAAAPPGAAQLWRVGRRRPTTMVRAAPAEIAHRSYRTCGPAV